MDGPSGAQDGITSLFGSNPFTESNPAVIIKVGVVKGSFSPGVIQKSSIKPNGSTPSTGEIKIIPLILWQPNFM